MTKLEFDNFAKEIFVAAQNHLTMAKSEDYLGLNDSAFGTPENENKKDGERYFVIDGKSSFGSGGLLDLMLPFGSVDEDVRTGGRYIVRYHKAAAQILDVFFWKDGDSRFGHTYNSQRDYADFMAKRANSAALKTYEGDNAVIGYYGGAEAQNLTRGLSLDPPEITVKNEETLTVEIPFMENRFLTDGAGMRLMIKGLTSGARRQPIELKTTNNVDSPVKTMFFLLFYFERQDDFRIFPVF